MGRCRFRPVAYRMGLCFVALGCALIAMGYGMPAWLRLGWGGTQGLWYTCTAAWESCSLVEHAEGLLMVVRTLLAMCLLLYLLTFAMALRENCCSPTFYTCCLAGRKTEILAFLAELVGISGVTVFSIDEYDHYGGFVRLSWAHALCGLGLATSLIGSIMMACAQQSLPAAKAAAGRIIAKPSGYENLSNNRSASLYSRSTLPSPYQGRTTPLISGPYPTPAAAAAASMVSPKQSRSGSVGSSSTPQLGRQTSPYPTMESQCSPSKRRKASGQCRQFAGVHNQGKHPPLLSNPRLQEGWEHAQSEHSDQEWSTHSLSLERTVQDDVTIQQRAIKTRLEQQQQQQQQQQEQQYNLMEQITRSGSEHRSWRASDERERSWMQDTISSTIRSLHQEQQLYSHNQVEQFAGMYPLPHHHAPQHAQFFHYNYQGHQEREPLTDHQAYRDQYSYGSLSSAEGRLHTVAEGRQPQQDYHHHRSDYFSYQSPPQSCGDVLFQPNHYQQQQQQQQHQQRPDSGNFPDPPPPEQLNSLMGDYEYNHPPPVRGDHPTFTGFVGYASPSQGPPKQQAAVQPIVIYRAPTHGSYSPVTETVVIRSQDSYHMGNGSHPTTPQSAHRNFPIQHHQQHAQQEPLYQQNHSLPRQIPGECPSSPQIYSTFGR